MPRGGPRPGAGAPRGNLNALKHGRTSCQLKRASRVLATLPRPSEAPVGIEPRLSQRKRAARMVAAHLLVSILERVPSRLEDRDGVPFRKVRDLLEVASDSRTAEQLTARSPS